MMKFLLFLQKKKAKLTDFSSLNTMSETSKRESEQIRSPVADLLSDVPVITPHFLQQQPQAVQKHSLEYGLSEQQMSFDSELSESDESSMMRQAESVVMGAAKLKPPPKSFKISKPIPFSAPVHKGIVGFGSAPPPPVPPSVSAFGQGGGGESFSVSASMDSPLLMGGPPPPPISKAILHSSPLTAMSAPISKHVEVTCMPAPPLRGRRRSAAPPFPFRGPPLQARGPPPPPVPRGPPPAPQSGSAPPPPAGGPSSPTSRGPPPPPAPKGPPQPGGPAPPPASRESAPPPPTLLSRAPEPFLSVALSAQPLPRVDTEPPSLPSKKVDQLPAGMQINSSLTTSVSTKDLSKEIYEEMKKVNI